MSTSDTTNLSGPSQHAECYDALREKINDTLNAFSVLPSKRKRTWLIFKYGWPFLLISYLFYFIVATFLNIPLCQTHRYKPYGCTVTPILSFLQIFGNLIIGRNKVLTGSLEIVFLVIGAIFLLWFFNIWQSYVPKMLRDLIENNRISSVGIGDTLKRDMTTAEYYLTILNKYCYALSKPTNYLLGIFIFAYAIFYIIFLGIIAYYQLVSFEKVPLFLFLLSLAFFMIIDLTLFYYFSIILSITVISGKFLRELLQVFRIKSDPTHLDHCGGLKQLGKFCLWLILPVLAVSLFFLIYDVAIFIFYILKGIMEILYLINFLAILVLCGLAFFLVIQAAVIPLWKIHAEMVDENEIAQQKQSTEINRLEKQLQDSIDKDQLEQAKVDGEKLALEKTLNISYPKWPFSKASSISIITSSTPGLLTAVLTLIMHMLTPK